MIEKKEHVDAIVKTPPRARGKPRNHRELAQAILARVDPVAVGCELLEGGSESVKARTLETVANWAFGSPSAAGTKDSGKDVRIVWDLLGPPGEDPSAK